MTLRLIHSDNLTAMSDLHSSGTRVHLAYLDPPFFTGRTFRTKSGQFAFDDRWPSLDAYVASIRQRVESGRALLTDDGCMVLHVDPTTSHYLKVACDEVFGRDCFASEIIWRYRRWPAKTRNFQRMHDVLLRYVRNADAEPRWNQLFEAQSASTLRAWGDRMQRHVVGSDGRHHSSSTDAISPGAALSDVWDISVIAPVAKERTGFPTQKPEALLTRIISACSHPGDTVLDPYCGSGTTLAAAVKLGRNAIGIDSGEAAIAVASERLGIEPERVAA